jgi:hypothetical protein
MVGERHGSAWERHDMCELALRGPGPEVQVMQQRVRKIFCLKYFAEETWIPWRIGWRMFKLTV